jgi:hypothetical protein
VKRMSAGSSFFQGIWDAWPYPTDVPYVLAELEALQESPYAPKSCKHIRAEKTRDYRKRRPKAKRYVPDCAMSAGMVFCIAALHLQSTTRMTSKDTP